jgi:hypothetical protein
LAKYLRDQHLKNITIDEETLDLIDEFLSDRETIKNNEPDASGANGDEKLLLTYIIRFDNRGYKLNEFADIKKYYSQASKVERLIFTLDSDLSAKTNRSHGSHFEIRLDAIDPNNSYIQVASDDRDAVDSVFGGLLDIIKKKQNKNYLVRNTWIQLLVQILGVSAGFVLSLIASLKISPNLEIENSFVITFIFAFLTFSNAWGFINQQSLRFLDYTFPNIRFNRVGKSALHWLAQTLVGGIVLALVLLLVGSIFEWFGEVLSHFVKK